LEEAKAAGTVPDLRTGPTLAAGTAGFLSRIEKSSLRFVPGFKEKVRAHLAHVRAIDDTVTGDRTLIAAE
jgi:DNA (cytosine-5)-methyltransferase 1